MIYNQQLGVALLGKGSVAIQFSNAAALKANDKSKPQASFVTPQELNTNLDVAYWGGDNLYPQHITEQLANCGVARSALDFKAKMLFGHGIVYGAVTDVDAKGNEIFTPAKPGQYPQVDAWFRENDYFTRFFLEFNQDWVQFGNCFPELIFSNDRKKIARIVHLESSDCRFKQMDTSGVIDTVYFSKFWAGVDTQYLKSSPDDTLKASAKSNRKMPKDKVDNDVVKRLRALDMYNAYADLQKVATTERYKSVILPVNYPSPGKTYYQEPVWTAVVLAGWIELAAKIPEMLKMLYSNAFNIKYHIEIPDDYFLWNIENWTDKTEEERAIIKQDLVRKLEQFLSTQDADNHYKSLVTFFKISPLDQKEYGRVKITPLDAKSNVDKDLLLSSAANQEILFALQLNPTLIGAGAPGGAYRGGAGSGSDIREAFTVYNSVLYIERQIILEPIKLAARFNGFPEHLEFRFKNIILTTLDKGSGSQEVVNT